MPFDLIVGRNESDKRDFGKRGLAYLGKSFVTMGNYTRLPFRKRFPGIKT